jgi:hypothetical protein
MKESQVNGTTPPNHFGRKEKVFLEASSSSPYSNLYIYESVVTKVQ